MQDKILDPRALFGALAMISVGLAMAFWLFACVRLFRHRVEERLASDQLAVSTFALQMLAQAAAIFLLPRELMEAGNAVLFSLELSLSIMTVLWASQSGSMTASRIKAALLFWIFGIVFSIGSPTILS